MSEDMENGIAVIIGESNAPCDNEYEELQELHPPDDNHSFFAKGRDFESANVNHKYTQSERQILAGYESLNYLPPQCYAYRRWLKLQNFSGWDLDRWVIMGVIGVCVGTLGFLLHQIIDVVAETKWEKARHLIAETHIGLAWLWVWLYSLSFVFASTAIVVVLLPNAQGSGLPELIGYLNGTLVRHIFNVKTLLVKFISCAFAVGSGLPVGPEGPMIHMGGLIGSGVSQLSSSTMRFQLPFFKRFRNPEDRRNFVSAGAAAGVASAFGAPVGGLLFAMEEVSSFWSLKLSWQTFFCCMVSTFTTSLLNSAFFAFKYQGSFGLFKVDKYILFQVNTGLQLNLIAFIPSVLLGILGGLFGAAFVFINLKINRARRRYFGNIQSVCLQRIAKMAEPLIIMTLMSIISVLLPTAFPCSPFPCSLSTNDTTGCNNKTTDVEGSVERYTCPRGDNVWINGTKYSNGSYNQAATLLFLTGEGALKHLFSRGTHLELDYQVLVAIFPLYFFLACWVSGSSISSGLVVPKLMIGALMGRSFGVLLVRVFGIQTEHYWEWMDPGAFALIGAVAFFGGVARLTMSLAVIMMELTNDIQYLLLIMVAIMVSKWVGDLLTHPLYHALLELRCIPFLDNEPIIVGADGKRVNLELVTVSRAMSQPVVTVDVCESVSRLAYILLNTRHGGFPVVTEGKGGKATYLGLISRLELTVLLAQPHIFKTEKKSVPSEICEVDYIDMQEDKLKTKEEREIMLNSYLENTEYQCQYLDLIAYVNTSAPVVVARFSLHRAHILLRTLGLRHLPVVDTDFQVRGIITRKDLMGFNLEERLLHVDAS